MAVWHSGKWTFYFGVSKDKDAETKLKWLFPGGVARNPVLLRPDGGSISRAFLPQLGPEGVVLHSSRLVFNELQLLWRLQEEFAHLPIGTYIPIKPPSLCHILIIPIKPPSIY
jgi:hypothetical protein